MTFKTYLHSFQPKREIFYSFLLDVLAIALIMLLLIGYGRGLQSRSEAMIDGKTIEEVKAQLLLGNEAYNQQFLAQVQTIALIFFLGGLLFLLASLFILSLSSKLEWNFLLKKQTKYWRWNGLTPIICLFAIFVALFYAGFNLLIGTFFPSESTLYLLFVRFIGVLLMLLFISYAFLANYAFNHSYQVWTALGEGFSLIRKQWASLWKAFLLSLGTFILLSLFIYLLGIIFSLSSTISTILGASLSLLFLSWMRYYYIRVLSHHD